LAFVNFAGKDLLDVPAHKLGHLEHGDRLFAAENGFQCIIGIDIRFLFLIL
jgi:hypothetical protein